MVQNYQLFEIMNHRLNLIKILVQINKIKIDSLVAT